jgi:CTP:molybdopterin cytidylyltransferase MocA
MDVKPYITEMKKLNGDMGLRETIEKNSKNVLFIEGDEGNVFDIDSEDEINILEERGYIIEKG